MVILAKRVDFDNVMNVITFRRGGGGYLFIFSFTILMNLMVRMTIMSLKAVITLVAASSIYHLLYRTQ